MSFILKMVPDVKASSINGAPKTRKRSNEDGPSSQLRTDAQEEEEERPLV